MHEFIIQESNGVSFNAVDLTGSTIVIRIWNSLATTVLETFAGSPALAITGAENNGIAVAITPASPAGSYIWELEVTFASGRKKTYVAGKFDIKGQ